MSLLVFILFLGIISDLSLCCSQVVVVRRQPLALDKDVKRQNASEIVNKRLN